MIFHAVKWLGSSRLERATHQKVESKTVKRLSSSYLAEAGFRLEIARLAQAEFWRTLKSLEHCLGVEVESTIDLRDIHVQDLRDPEMRRQILGVSEERHIPMQ